MRLQKYRRLSLFLPARSPLYTKGQVLKSRALGCIISSLSIFSYVTAKKFTALATGTLHRFRLSSSEMIPHCFNINKINQSPPLRPLNIIHVICVTHWHANVAICDSCCLIYAVPLENEWCASNLEFPVCCAYSVIVFLSLQYALGSERSCILVPIEYQ